ncbi:MAG TPA: SgcJ/EcaC family oxidoreductase [Gemmatimonadales bacterium]|nr:SgcJ/EcaC family oxidoreductase [Gemmatimonadales bacterium]
MYDPKVALPRLYAALLDAWNRRDAAAFARLFTADGTTVGFDGTEMRGAAAIERHLRDIFADHRPAAYVAVVREVRLLSPGSALLRGAAGLVPPGESSINPRTNAIQTLVALEDGGEWRIELFQNTPAAWDGRPNDVSALTAELQRAADAR